MIALQNILSPEIVQKVGWTLLHFVWQAAAVALLLAILLAVLRKTSANLRYIIACSALALIVLLPVVTIQLVPISVPHSEQKTEFSSQRAEGGLQKVEAQSSVLGPQSSIIEKPLQPEGAGPVFWKQRTIELFEPALPYIVSGWLLGVFGLSVWHLGGWAQLQRLRRKMVKQVDTLLHSKLKELAEKLKVNRAVQLLESSLVQVPTVVGWLRPVILLPASALTGLSTEQLEAMLAHELAHVKRFDYLVNMLQTVVEILGFYHPVVWWISHKIRAERENCCDDLAVSVSGDRIRYARALTIMEEIRSSQGELAIAANGGSLFARISRLVGKESSGYSRDGWIPSAITILLIVAMIIPTTIALTSGATKEPITEQKEKPTKSLHEAVRDGDIEQVKSLILKGADVNAKDDRWGGTPLHLAAAFAHRQAVELIIANGADVNAKNKYGRTPLHDARDRGQTEIVELLRKHGAETKDSVEPEKTKPGKSLFELATTKFVIPKENLEIPEEMRSCAANLQKIFAAIKKYEKDKGSLPNWLSDLVPDYLSKEMLLCPHNPNYRAVFVFGPQIPLEPKLPCSYRYQFSMARLPAATPSPTGGMITRDRKMAQMRLFGDVVPLIRCSTHGDILNISLGGQLYVSRMSWEKLFMPDYVGGLELPEEAPVMLLHKAAADGDIEQVKLLISKGADVNAKRGRLGWTPLHRAAEHGHREVAETLIAKGADINAKDNKGQTALSLAKEQGYNEIVELLRKHGAEE